MNVKKSAVLSLSVQQWSKKLLNLFAFTVHDSSSGLSCHDVYSIIFLFFFMAHQQQIPKSQTNDNSDLFLCLLFFFFSPHTVWFLPYTLHRFGYRHNYILRDDEQRLILPSVCFQGKKIRSKNTFWDLTGLSFFQFHFF